MARIQLEASTFTYNYIGSENRVYLRQFPSGALNLDHLDIVFTDPLGRLIEFNGADPSFQTGALTVLPGILRFDVYTRVIRAAQYDKSRRL